MAAVAPIVVEPPASAAVACVARPLPGAETLGCEARLVAAVRAGAPLRRALASVAARMSACRGWERLGFARPGDYAAERAGVSARELRDLACVGRRLADLPALDAAFLSGAIGWTQLRLLCRVATPDDEHAWLDLAKRLGARALAREVRTVDRRAREPLAETEDEGETRRVGVTLRVSRAARARWWRTRGVASRVAGHALSHAAFAEVLAAEVLSGVALDGEADVAGALAEPRTEQVAQSGGSAARAPRRGSPVSIESEAEFAEFERDLTEVDAFELDRRLRALVGLEARGLARVAGLLAEVASRKLFRDAGYNGLDAYAEERVGISASRARALLRIERAGRRCAPLREALVSGRLSWVKAHALVPLLLEPASARWRADWVAHARRVTVRRLGDDVERALATGETAPPSLDARPAGLQTGAIARHPKEDVRLYFPAAPGIARLFRAVLATVQRRLERIRGRPACTSEALEAMLDHALAAWEPEVPTARQRREQAVFERDGWRCTAPGCTSYRNLQKHHVVFRSRGGSDDDSNLTTLCAWHHLRGVHGGVLRCTGTAPDGLRFALGLRTHHAPLAVYGPGDVLNAP